jgi:uncharacterized protein (DUF924 family)
VTDVTDVNEFWFRTLEPRDWYAKSDELDARIKQRFEVTYHQAVAGETAHWRDTAEGRLAEIIVLDQFARNMFRGTAESFSADPIALVLAQETVRSGDDQKLENVKQAFVYMPFMHSESPRIHEEAMNLFEHLSNLDFEIKHKAIIDRFGRYPHRNVIVGRESTAEEVEWMKTNRGF